MERLFARITPSIVVSLVLSLSLGCVGPTRSAVLIPDGSPSFALMDFSDPPSLDPVSPGWEHRTFLRHPPMQISFVSNAGRDAIRLSTQASASILFRFVEVKLDAYPLLSWDWLVEQGIVTSLDEMTVAGDDHPARLYLGFESATGKSHSMEIIWGSQSLKKGDWKHLNFYGIRKFAHYVANGGDENIGRWHHERVDISELYSTLWGNSEGAHLVKLGLFCDTDDTGAESTAYFANLRVEVGRSDRGMD